MHKDKLGTFAQDLITGYTGVIVAYDEWLNGCVRFAIQPQDLDKDGQLKKAQWFDSPQVKFLPERGNIFDKPARKGGGGPRPAVEENR